MVQSPCLQPEGDASSFVYLIHALLATLWIVFQRAMRAYQSRAILALENRRRPPRLTPAT